MLFTRGTKFTNYDLPNFLQYELRDTLYIKITPY